MANRTSTYGPGVAGYIAANAVTLRNGAAGIITARRNATLRDGATGLAVAHENLALTNGGGAVFVAGGDLTIQNGGGAVFVAGGDLTIQNGGGAVFVSRTARVRHSIVVFLAAPHVHLHEGSRVLITPAVAAIFGASAGLVAGLVRRGR